MWHKSLKTQLLGLLTLGSLALGMISTASAHGLMEDPPGRNWFCGAITKPDQVINGVAQYPVCGGAFAINQTSGYNFMSVLTHALGRAVVTPLPVNVCGFNSENWQGGATPWDQPIDWPTSQMAPGRKKITWNISWGPHFSDTQEFRYWITKPGFQFKVGTPLTWADFEDANFCALNYDDANPTANPDVVPDPATAHFNTYCTIPARSGRHVIYGEWGRKPPTFERFHGCMDVVFDGTVSPVTAKITMTPNVTEFTGAGTIVFDASTSTGTNLKYQWTVNAPNPALYSFDTPTAASTHLIMAAPSATETVQVSVAVSNADGSNNASKTFTHKPVVATNWVDLGALTPSARTMVVGDKVNVRVVLSTGLDAYYPATPIVITAANAGPTAWPLALAQAVNALNAPIRIGVLSGQTVTPAADATANRVYATSTAGINSAFLTVTNTPPPPAVSATYTINNDWGAGYCANIKVTNNGTTAVTWATTFKVVGKVGQLWNGVWSQTADTISISGPAWSSTLAPGASFTQAGFCATR